MLNQEELFKTKSNQALNSNKKSNGNSSILSSLNLPTYNNFDHKQNLVYLAHDLLKEANKFSNQSNEKSTDDENDDDDEEDDEIEEEDENSNDVQITDEQISTYFQPDCSSTEIKPNNNKKRKLDQIKNGSNKPKKKTKNQYQRKNIKKIIGEEKLNESTLRALQEEQERQMRLKIDNYNQINHQNILKSPDEINKSNSSSDQSILLLENESVETNNRTNDLVRTIDSISRMNRNFLKQENSTTNKIIEYEDLTQSDNEIIEEDYKSDYNSYNYKNLNDIKRSNDDDDDDCRILSESEHQQEEAFKKKTVRGIHMNDELNRPDSNGRVLVNVNHPAEDEDIYLLPFLAKNIKSHQIGGIRFIYDNIVESLSRVKNKSSGFGCILAHAMGLGKTFQIITFIEIFLRSTDTKRVLCIVPINTIQNWLNEFNYWLPEDGQQKLDNDTIINYKRPFKVYLINDCSKTMKQRTDIILDWNSSGGVLLIGYEMFRTLVSLKTNVKTNKKPGKGSTQSLDKFLKNQSNQESCLIDLEQEEIMMNKQNELEEALLSPCLVVCDEGHRIKNSSANIAKTLQRIKTKRRIVLTGYPLQNNLIEYWCMVDFVRPSYLGNKSEFSNMFERPIMNGQCVDSTREDIKLMRYRAHVLHSLLEGFVQRRGHDVFLNSLPKKYEFIILLKLSSIQKELYLAFMQAIGAMNPGEKTNPLRTFAICCKIWNHPDVLYKYNQNKDSEIDLDLPELQQNQTNTANKQKRSNNSNNYNQQPQYVQTTQSCVMLEDSGFNPFASTMNDSRYNNYNKSSFDPDWANRILERYQQDQLEYGAKLMVAFSIIEESIKVGDKILLFSQSLLTLNLIEDYLQKFYVPNTNEKWQKYKSYFRLDGSTSGTERERLIGLFNKPNNGIWLFLLSTRAGCLGINLVGANRVIILDASWNPCHDAQAVCRVFRYGQTKNSFIYRLIADHTMEKKIYDRQISKQTMSDRVVDEIQSENHFTRTEVEKLIHYVKEDQPVADLSTLPYKYNDHVLINSCFKHSNVITKEPFTHESLLLDKKEYQLSEREKAMALKEYQHDKKYFPYARTNSYSLYYNRYPVNSQQLLQNQIAYSNHHNLQHSLSSINLTSTSIAQNLTTSNKPFNTTNTSFTSSNNINDSNSNKFDFNIHRSFSTSVINNNLNKSQTEFIQSNQNLHSNLTNSIISQNNPELVQQQQQQQQQQFTDQNQSSNNNIQFSQLKDVKITSFIASSQFVINTSVSETEQTSILIQQGEKVYILKTPKGCYLRTPDKRYIALRNKSIEDSIVNLNETIPSLNSQTSPDLSTFNTNVNNNNQIGFNNELNSNAYGQFNNDQYYMNFNNNNNINNNCINESDNQIGSNSNFNYYSNQTNINNFKIESATSAEFNCISEQNYSQNNSNMISIDNIQNQMISVMQPTYQQQNE